MDAPRTKVTAQEFRQLPETLTPTELIDGEVIVSPSPIATHQRVVVKSVIVLEKWNVQGTTYVAPMDVEFDEENTPQPDIFWIAKENTLCILSDNGKYFRGAPDLIIEVLSDGSIRRDRKTKYQLYEKYGVREYWIVDPMAQLVEVFTLIDGKYALQGIYEPGETFSSTVLPDSQIAVRDLFDMA
ncbi:MAG: Uma2 family endonuclease [Anaerolineae bacterium]|nr:Uma2 family endonuclease [Anaerolineae bacterium]